MDTKEVIGTVIRALLVVGIFILMFQLGQMNAMNIEEKIQDYCASNINYSISPIGDSLALWKNQPPTVTTNFTFGDNIGGL